MYRARRATVVMTPARRARFAALALALLVVCAVLGSGAARRAGVSNDRMPASSFVEQRNAAAVAPAEVTPTETALSRSHQPPPLAFLLIIACSLAISVCRLKTRRRPSPRRSLEQFFVLRRGPPLLLGTR